MKLVLLLSVLYVVSSETDYGNLNKTDSEDYFTLLCADIEDFIDDSSSFAHSY